MSEESPVVVSRAGAVGVIELASPEKLNSLSSSTFRGIERALDEFEEAGSEVRVVLVRAQGKHFCAGADLVEAKALRTDPEAIAGFIRHGHRVLKRLEASDRPFVAACQGLALAGGGELMLGCDVVFAATDFRFGDQHARYGLVPGFGGTQRLPRLVGLRRAVDLFYSAKWIDAPTALQWGLVNYVVEPAKLWESALEYCTELATRSPRGIAQMKALARRGLDGTREAGLKMEEEAASRWMVSEDVSEGLAAFEARRAPVFKL
jgi:enoyl-CoA hydratase